MAGGAQTYQLVARVLYTMQHLSSLAVELLTENNLDMKDITIISFLTLSAWGKHAFPLVFEVLLLEDQMDSQTLFIHKEKEVPNM